VMCCTTRSHLKLVERFGTVKQIGLSVITKNALKRRSRGIFFMYYRNGIYFSKLK
jgi:hypothetical protein